MIINRIEITEEQANAAGYKLVRIEPELPAREKTGLILSGSGVPSPYSSDATAYYEDYAIYPTIQQANRASTLITRAKAIIKACLMADPDYVPNWNDATESKFGFKYHHNNNAWGLAEAKLTNSSAAHVSTREKAELALRLLTEWGIE